MMKRKNIFHVLVAISVFTIGCRKDPKPIQEEVKTIFPAEPNAIIKGFYLINEGNMYANKASIDYIDFTKGEYRKNTYNKANPEITKGLGDVANDVAIYGSKLYVIVNGSNKIEVLDAKTNKRIKQIDLLNCRYLAVHNGKVYASAYLGKIGDPNSPQGIVAEIDTNQLAITRKVDVGRQPEELVIVDEKIYVANSGGYTPKNYERTVSVIDISTFSEIKRIDLAINLHRLKADSYGDLYVTSRGDYDEISPKIFVIDTKTDFVKKQFDISASNFWIDGDEAYIFGSDYNYNTQKYEITYSVLNVKDELITDKKFITDGTDKLIDKPYGIMVHPITKEVYVTDAKDYLTPGVLYCFDRNGKKKWQAETGDIPSCFALVYK